MSVIATTIEPHNVARIFFDCRAADPDPDDEARIARVIERAAVLAARDMEAEFLSVAA
jgi:hypothetical protein